MKEAVLTIFRPVSVCLAAALRVPICSDDLAVLHSLSRTLKLHHERMNK